MMPTQSHSPYLPSFVPEEGENYAIYVSPEGKTEIIYAAFILDDVCPAQYCSRPLTYDDAKRAYDSMHHEGWWQSLQVEFRTQHIFHLPKIPDWARRS